MSILPPPEKENGSVEVVSENGTANMNEPMSRFRSLARRLVGVTSDEVAAAELQTATQNDAQKTNDPA